MKLLTNLIKKPQIYQRTLGLKIEQFDLLVSRINPLWKAAEEKRKMRDSRKRKLGGGRHYHMSLEEMVATVLLYYRTYMTQEFAGIIIGLDQSNVSRLLKKILLLIEEAADPELATYLKKAKEEFDAIPSHQRTSNWDAFIAKYPDLKAVSTDATEHQIQRASDYAEQKKSYSGKSKQHAAKTQLTVSDHGRILDISNTVPGSVHDKTLIDAEQTVQKFPEKTTHRMDGGYQGVKDNNPDHYIVLPIRKQPNQERSQLEKEINKAHSKRRVKVENAICRLKKSKILDNRYRGNSTDYNHIFRNIAAIENFKLANKAVTVMS